MKKLNELKRILILFFTCIALLSFGQSDPSKSNGSGDKKSTDKKMVDARGTTKKEFDYLTQEYGDLIKKRKPLKEDYTFVEMYSTKYESRKMTFKGMIRKGETKPAAILVLYESDFNDDIDYLCIPNKFSSEEMWEDFYYYLRDGHYSARTLSVMFAALSRAYSNYSTE
jgi:hypothetical protein